MDLAELRQKFQEPGRNYGPTTFFALNDSLDPDRLRAALGEFAARGFAGVFMHPRTGLEVPYLSETFWERVRVIVEECERLGLKAWIYDEYNWPSGVAGGRALDGRPEFLMPYLEYAQLKVHGGEELVHPGRAVAAFSVDHRINDLSEHVRDGRFEAPEDFAGDLLLFYEDMVTDNTFATQNATWCSGVTGYLDLMNSAAVEHFMALTHREYAKRFKDHFGHTIPGVFTDEPQFYRGFPWTGALAARFREEHGYDLVERLYMLVLDRGEYRKLRYDYYATVEELYAESFYGKVRAWCDEQGLIFTGHLGMEERLRELAVNHGGIYKPLKCLTMPGIDALGHGNPVAGGLVNMESPHFSPRAAAAVSRLHADGQVLCEAGGGSGWEATPFMLKRQLDWLFASGVTFINPHQSLLSVKGLRKRDFPVSHFKQEPWWDHYRVHCEYVQRMSMVMTEGAPVRDVLLYFPMASLRASQRGRGMSLSDEAQRFLIPFHSIMEFLVRNQRDFELLFEEAVAEGKVTVEGGKLRMAGSKFSVLVMTPSLVVHKAVPAFLAEFLEGGGRMVMFEQLPRWDTAGREVTEKLLPAMRRAVNEGRAVQLSSSLGFTREGLRAALDKLCPPDIVIESEAEEDMISRHVHRDGLDLYFIANLGDDDADAEVIFRSLRPGLARLDPVSGECINWPWSDGGEGRARVELGLHSGESVLLAWHDAQLPTERITGADLRVLEYGPEKVRGLSPAPRVEVRTTRGPIVKESPSPPLPIVLRPEWEMESEAPNVMLVGPWNVKTERTRPLPLAGLNDEKYFTTRTRRLVRIGRVLVRAVELIRPPAKNYRTERYFDFSAPERMQRPVSKITGIDLGRWGLYESTGAMERLADYLGVSTVMRTFPPAEAAYTARAVFLADHVPDDLVLVYEDLGVPISFELNGRELSGSAPAAGAWDPCCRAFEVSGAVKPGKNVLVMRSTQMNYRACAPNTHSIEPVALMGSFAVRNRRLASPEPGPRPDGEWTARGYPWYSGAMVFRASFDLPAEYLDYCLELELGDVRECAEVRLNGESTGVRIYPPFAFPLAGAVRAGKNELEIRVVNTAANFFARPRPSGIMGAIRIVPYVIYDAGIGEVGGE